MSPDTISEQTELVSDAVRVLYLQHYCQHRFRNYDQLLPSSSPSMITIAVLTFEEEAHDITQLELIWCRYIGNIMILGETYLYLNQQPTDASLVAVVTLPYLILACSCMWGTRVLAVVAFICTWTTQLILQFRIQALYDIFAGGVIGLVILGVLSLNGMNVVAEPIPGIRQCTCVKLPSYAFMFWFPILFFDTLLFLLAIGIVVINWRRQSSQALLSPEHVSRSLVAIVLRDNFGYFFLVFGIYLTTTVIWLAAEPKYFSIPACFSYSIVTIMGCRLILNLCHAYHNPESYLARGTSEWDSLPPWRETPTSPSIRFVGRQADGTAPPQIQYIPDVGPSVGSGDVELSTASDHGCTGYADNVNKKEHCWERECLW
ncbi:hypothetical protein P691DRAFT_790150 [Macrolepiota fuliginosa MF-IS2]|uniref:Uncharacterized protein n=1 Tax=Macrolepiota fuliginosa MF-IS2 TaxID=1400762 RepID=A0A9P6C610_9AGAR|nr:hypothetical protein P691DRAFT_790150 [Macrolepiota fuliginosa MF-IS2]